MRKTQPAKILSLLVAATLCFTVFTVPVSAEDSDWGKEKKDEKSKLFLLEEMNTDESEPAEVVPVFSKEEGTWTRVHSNPATFQKNYILSPEKKEYSIKGYEDVISQVLKPKMSDLEKYYTLAIWLNRYVDYDWGFWPGGYDFDHYSHQWDAYGILKERKSVCAGIAIAYANLCHAANLPCKFIRMKPFSLDHTINYIPDINGHAYYIDVTEDIFFMSKDTNPWDPMDPEFSGIDIAKLPDDGSFEYKQESNEYTPTSIKAFYDVPFDKWYKEYALHQNTKKKFRTKYVEKGSGTRGTHYAEYTNTEKYPPQTYESAEATGIWFLDDFYEDPKAIEAKILGKELDEQLLDISGTNVIYDCSSAEDLAVAVSRDIRISYFPSAENDNIVATSVDLNHADYTVSCNDFDLEKGEATITITGAGEYSGKCQVPVKINSAVVTKEPVNNMDLVYSGETQTLVNPGNAKKGTILYAMYKKDRGSESWDESWMKGNPDAEPDPYPPSEDRYSEEIPTAVEAGKYVVWYKVVGEDPYSDIGPQKLDRVAVISCLQPKILAKNVTMKVGEKLKLTPTLDMNKAVSFDFVSSDDDIVNVSADGTLIGVGAGTTEVGIDGTLKNIDPNYGDPATVEITVKVNKGKNPMKLKGKTVKVKRSKLKKKAQNIKRTKLITVSKAKGKLTYKLVSAKKGKKSFKKRFKVNAKTGKLTVKKGLKKGKYSVKVKVKAAGNANYLPSSWKTVTYKVVVK